MRKPRSFFKRKPIAFLSLALAILPLAAEEPLEISLGEALMRVEAENLEVILNREATEQALAAVARERSPLFPQFDIEISQARNRPASARTDNSFDGRMVGRVPLLDPVLIGAYRVAQAGVEVTELEQQRILQEILNATAFVYLTHLRDLKRLQVIEANIELGEGLLELARNQFEAGVATRIDITRAEVQLAIDEQARLQQETVIFASEVSLKQLLNFDLQIPIQTTDFIANRFIPGAVFDVDVNQVLQDRPDYLRGRSQLDQNRLIRRSTGWERFPALWAFGDYGYASREVFDGNAQQVWGVGITAVFPIFDGFRIRANEDQADSRIRASQVELQIIARNVSGELLVAWKDMQSRLAQISVVEQNLSLSEEELRLARLGFERGVADNREVIDAQNNVAVARDNRVEAIHRYNLSRLEYARSKGDVRLLLADQQVSDSTPDQ